MIDRDQWLKALGEVGITHEDDQQAVTIAEFAALMGLKREASRSRLDALVTAGKAARTSKRAMQLSGRMYSAVAYRLLDKKRKRGVS